MADNNPSPSSRAQPENEYYYRQVTGYNYFNSYQPIPYQLQINKKY